MGIKLIKKTNESFESDLENIAQTSGEIEYDDAWKLNGATTKDPELRTKVRNLIGDWRSAAEDEDNDEMTKAAKALKALADSLPKQEARIHLGRCKNEGKFTEIKAAIKAAWSAAEAKWFRLNFQESTERLDVYPIASDNEGVGVNWGVLPERNTIVQYATDYRTGNSEIERDMPYKDVDELEKIFVDEFKAMDETLEIGAENGADIHPLTESRPTENEVDKFLHNALDWASIEDGENRVILKFIADAGDFELVGYDGRARKTLSSGRLFSVVDRYRELVEMDPEDAIREFEKE